MSGDSKSVFIVWKDEYSVHNETIDKQHAELVGTINTLYNALQTSEDRESVGQIIKQLQDYADRHLREEVEMMRAVNYPEIESHTKHHEKLREALQTLETQHSHSDGISMDVLITIKQWWIEHETNLDRKYVNYIHEYDSKNRNI